MINTEKTSWDLSPLLKNDDDPSSEQKLEEVKKANFAFVQKWKERKDYLQNPAALKEALDDLEKIAKHYGTSGAPGLYFTLRSSVDQANTEITAKLNKIEELAAKISNDSAFFTINLAKIQKEEQQRFLSSPELADYKHFLELLFKEAKYILTEPEEKILNLKSSVAHEYWERMTSSLLAKQEKEVLGQKKSFSEILELTKDKDKETREAATKAFNEILARYSEVAEAEMNAILANKKINDELRGFSRPDSARHLTDDIETETVDKLIESVTEKFNLTKKYYEIKAKLLKVPKLKYEERSVSYGEQNKEYPYPEAMQLVHKTFNKLDKRFSDILEEFSEKGQIEVFPKKGKQSGAFCMHNLPTQPAYLLLNHNNTLDDVTIIAHEAGHGINAELMKERLNALNMGTPKSTAEVASTFFEDFVLDEVMKEANEEERLAIMMEKLDGDTSSIFRQTAFYNFEMELHNSFRRKGYLSKEEIGELFKKHMSSYMGSAVDTSTAGDWWVYVPHFRYIFYVYSYTSGLLISKSLQSKVKQNPEFIEKVKDFLSSGTSDSPENIFKKMGIDITNKEFWTQGLSEFEDLLAQTEQLAKKLGRL